MVANLSLNINIYDCLRFHNAQPRARDKTQNDGMAEWRNGGTAIPPGIAVPGGIAIPQNRKNLKSRYKLEPSPFARFIMILMALTKALAKAY